MIKLKKHFKKIHDKPEEDRIKIMWFAVVFCMVIILGGWFFTYKLNTRENRIANNNLQTPFFSDLQNSIDDMDRQKEEALEEILDIAQKVEIESIALIHMEENELTDNDSVLDLKLENIKKLENNWHLEYRQYYQNVLVNDSAISFLIDDTEKKVISHTSNFDSAINLSAVEPKITEEEAYEIAKEDLSENLNSENFDLKNSELVIYKKEDKKTTEYFLTWKLNIFSLEPLCDYYYFIDAENGIVIVSFEKSNS